MITVEENVLSGGLGTSVIKLRQELGINDVHVKNIGIPDEFVEQGTQDILRSKSGLNAKGIVQQVLTSFPNLNTRVLRS